MSTTLRYPARGPATDPWPYALAEQIHRYTHCRAFADPLLPDDSHAVIHVLAPPAVVDEAARFFLEPMRVSYSVRGEASA